MNDSIALYKALKTVKDYKVKNILRKRLCHNSAKGIKYSIYMDIDEIIHIYPEVYVPECRKDLRESNAALCEKYPAGIRHIFSGLLEKEVKRLVCEMDAIGIKVCGECAGKMYINENGG